MIVTDYTSRDSYKNPSTKNERIKKAAYDRDKRNEARRKPINVYKIHTTGILPSTVISIGQLRDMVQDHYERTGRIPRLLHVTGIGNAVHKGFWDKNLGYISITWVWHKEKIVPWVE